MILLRKQCTSNMNRKMLRCFLALAIATVILLIWYVRSSSELSYTCFSDSDDQRKVANLAYRVHNLLAELHLTHSLCYGALWSAVQKGSIIPWEGDIKLCVLNNEILSIEENYFIRYFRDKKLLLSYNSGEGYFTVNHLSSPSSLDVKLVVFEALDGDMMRRIGWKRRLLPPNCEMTPSLQCFPSRLMMEPLPKVSLGSDSLPVPREGIEMLKYQYPDSWWLDILPNNCR